MCSLLLHHIQHADGLQMTDLYESGQLPLLYAKEKAKSQGVSWQREGQVVSYYCIGRQHSASLVIPFPNPSAFYITVTPATQRFARSSPLQTPITVCGKTRTSGVRFYLVCAAEQKVAWSCVSVGFFNVWLSNKHVINPVNSRLDTSSTATISFYSRKTV